MTPSRVSYREDGGVAVLTLDDGKVNVLSEAMLADIDAALDRAERDGAVVVLTGRDGVFTAGFDLRVLRAGGSPAVAMLRAGFDLAERLLQFPEPVVIACSGHAVAMGTFLLLSADYRIGVRGAAHKITANEVAIGLTMPRAAVEICRERLAPAHLQRAVNLAEEYTPDGAVEAGFLDAVVPADELHDAAMDAARRFAGLDRAAHRATKLRVRHDSLTALRAAIEADQADLVAALS